jgi:hypothetical protein
MSGRALLLSLALLLLAPAAAQADFGFSGSLEPDQPQAGAHSDVVITTTFTGDENPDRVVLRFPPGLVGNPSAAERCPLTTFRSGTCPANTQVGSVTGQATLFGLPVIGGVTGTVSNLEPAPGEPARLGIFVSPLGLGLLPTRNEAAISLRPDGGLDSTIAGIAASLPAGAKLQSLEITLDDTFMTLPTSCAPATTTLTAAPVGGPTIARTDAFTPTGCDQVPFQPSAGIDLETDRRAATSGYTVSLSLPAGETPVRQSHVRRAEVVLPEGTTLSPAVATHLQACTDAQFTQGSCPVSSQIGSVSFVTPLIGMLRGTVAFGEPRNGAYRLLVEVDEQGVRLDMVGTVTLDPRTGRITTVFDGLPQVPFTSFALSFRGGSRAVLANPPACGTYALSARLTPWSGGAVATRSASFAIDTACDAPFRPGLGVAVASTAAGRPAGAVSIAITRPDGDQELRRVTTELPPGLAGNIAGIELCPEDRANAGTCADASRLGTVSALVGPGTTPVPLTGTVYLTGPAEGGIVGMAIVIPGRVGPVDLGTVVTRAGISLRPADGGLTVRTGELPRMVGGVPVSIRQLTLQLNRPGFMLNASGCSPQVVRAVLESAGGAVATPTAPYQATDCAGLPFAPRVSARIGSRRKPALRTVITVPPGHAATRQAAVTLPRGVSPDLEQVRAVCQPGAACPAGARIGRAVAQSPLLPVPLSGPVYLALVPGESLPGLVLDLGGPVSLRLTGTVRLTDGGLRTQFAGIPDVPLSRFELRFDRRALVTGRNLCRGKAPRIAAELTGHNGVVANLRRQMRVTGCKPIATLRRRGGALRLRVTAARSGAALRRVRVKLPESARARARAGKRRLRSTLRRGVLTVRARRARAITVTIRGATPRRLRVTTLAADGRRARVVARRRA